jgi:limonene-1,2-epoxide hydrolase
MTRRIGPVGTAVRVLAGLALLYVSGAWGGLDWGVEARDLLVGFVALPAISLSLGLAARRYSAEPVRFDGPLGTVVNCGVIVALIANGYTGSGATLFYGTTLLVAAWRGMPGCEATVLPNLILGRDDQIGCPTFTPIDRVEARLRRKTPSIHGAEPIEVVVGWMDAMRRGDLAAAVQWFEPHVIWRGISADAVCRGRDDVREMLGDSLVPCPDDPGAHELEPGLRGAEAVELVSAGAGTVVLGAKLPGVHEAGGVPVDGQFFNVFRVRDGRIVHVDDYARREEALAAAGAQPPRWR